MAVVSSLTLIVAACGGGDGDLETIAATDPSPPTDEASPTTDAIADPPPPAESAPPDAQAADAADEQNPGDEAAAPPAGPNDLPAVVVRDIATGDDVDLSAFAPGELPFVVWFWAPH